MLSSLDQVCPQGLVEEFSILFRQILSCLFRIYINTHAWTIPDLDQAVLHDRVRQPFDNVIPPCGISTRILECNEVVRQSRAHLHQSGQSQQSVARAVRRNHNAVQISELSNPFQLGDTTDIAWVGTYNAYCVALDEVLEVLTQIDLLSGVNGCGRRACQFAIDVGIDIGM